MKEERKKNTYDWFLLWYYLSIHLLKCILYLSLLPKYPIRSTRIRLICFWAIFPIIQSKDRGFLSEKAELRTSRLKLRGRTRERNRTMMKSGINWALSLIPYPIQLTER